MFVGIHGSNILSSQLLIVNLLMTEKIKNFFCPSQLWGVEKITVSLKDITFEMDKFIIIGTRNYYWK